MHLIITKKKINLWPDNGSFIGECLLYLLFSAKKKLFLCNLLTIHNEKRAVFFFKP